MVRFVRILIALSVLVGLSVGPTAAQNCNGQFSAGYVCGNKNNATGFPAAASISSMLDAGLGSTRGSIIERGSSAWQAVTPGQSGFAWVSNGPGIDPSYQAIGGSAFGPQTSNTFFSGPTTGSAANPTFRAIVPADLPGIFSGFANPTGLVGLSPVNGTATTAIRSDGASGVAQEIALPISASRAPVVVATTGGNITLSGEQTIDGVLTSSSRVLVKDQSTPSQNGIYVSGIGVWTRAADFNTTGQVVRGTTVLITQGTLNKTLQYAVVTANPITIGSTSIVFNYSASSPTVQPRIVTTAGDVTVSNGDIFITLHKTVAADTTFQLPSYTTKVGAITIWDADGVFFNHTQLVVPFGSETIYGLSAYPMTEAYQNLTFYPTALGWMVGKP